MKVLYCGETFPEARRRLAARLSGMGHEFIACAEGDIVRRLDGVDVVIPAIARIDAALIERGSFGLIQQFGVGLDTVDIEAATRHGVWVARVPGSVSGNAASVAEHAMLLMLTLSRKMAECGQALANRSVGFPLGSALLGKTACIVGMGNIGTALAIRLGACGMRLLAVDDHPGRTIPDFIKIDAVYTLGDLPRAVAEADYIAVCINYRPGLRHLIGETVLATAQPGALSDQRRPRGPRGPGGAARSASRRPYRRGGPRCLRGRTRRPAPPSPAAERRRDAAHRRRDGRLLRRYGDAMRRKHRPLRPGRSSALCRQ